MSSRDSFWFPAGVLVTVAIVVIARAWLRERPAQNARSLIPSIAVPIAAALALIGVALGIYVLLGPPDSVASDHVATVLGARAASHSGAAQISGTVDIASKLAAQAGSRATLFIYAKQPGAQGPPLAIVRTHADHWPVTFTLSDDNALVPGRNLSNANNVQIEARISRDGDALPHSGDLVGTVTSVNPRDGHIVRISIDRPIG